MQRAHRLAELHRVADTLVKLDPDGGIDFVFLQLSAAAKDDARQAQLLTLDRADKSVARAANLKRVARVREAPGIVHDAHVAALQPHDFTEFFASLPGGDQVR